ncbi:ATP synthase F1 subunit delta [Humisphaera borealis]|uniref:ATP synthase subunit delta n=1 Tax=Humisphaera borealis TaxID=2807512 RepID=A0A7M2WUS0_9BACT|nr:ATP synthase F1 subunit delta [Humisphaera borealis]QOV89143.1 ATP synthase F1 subunit delta [Humisphaera borealis]
MSSSTVANAYARSLLDLANGQSQATEIGQELSQIKEVLDAEPAFAAMLSNPAISEASRVSILQRAFEGKVHPLVWNFLRVLNVKGRLGELRAIDTAYSDMLDEQFGKVEVDVTVAQRLEDWQLEQVRQAVSSALKRDAVVHQYVDESIIGGLILRVQDKLIDTSVRGQLASIKQKMLAVRPTSASV